MPKIGWKIVSTRVVVGKMPMRNIEQGWQRQLTNIDKLPMGKKYTHEFREGVRDRGLEVDATSADQSDVL